MKRLLNTLPALLLACILCMPARAHVVEDSLRKVLSAGNLPAGERVMTLGRLANVVFFGNRHAEAIQLLQEALQHAKRLDDTQYRAFAFASLCFQHRLADSTALSLQDLDSALYYSERTGSRVIKGYVQYCKGWTEARQNQPHKAVNSLQQGLRLLQGQGAWKYERSIYTELAGIYSDWQDFDNWDKYTRLCMDAALKSNTPDDIASAGQMRASYFEYRYRGDTSNRPLLDSAFAYNRLAIAACTLHRERLAVPSQLPLTILNVANLYAEFYPPAYKDSVLHYLGIALREGEATQQYSVVANCYGMMSDYATAAGNYGKAERLLLAAMSALMKESVPNISTLAQVNLSLSSIGEKKGDLHMALKYYRQYVEYYRQIFDAEKMSIGKRLEAQYESEKKEQALAALHEKIAFSKKLNRIYIFLAGAGALALLFLFYAYTQRSRAMRQQQQLHQLELQKIKQGHRISLLSAMLKGQEQERTRLARDLHDGLGGLLSGIKIEFSGMVPRLQEPASRQLAGKTLQRLDNAVDELRRIAHSMMPEMLLKYGLGEAIREYCKRLKETGVNIICQVFHYTNDMEHSRQLILYRIMQELVNNAVKHAGASRILVQLQQSEETISLTVEDDGRGFDTAALENAQGAGLTNIQSRVEFLNGNIDIQSQPGIGTTIIVECTIR